MRRIAAAAKVDPALVIRHYGSKELLFLETMQWDGDEDDVFGGPLEQLGITIADYVVRSTAASGCVRCAATRER